MGPSLIYAATEASAWSTAVVESSAVGVGEQTAAVSGALAIVLPVVAVAALSLAAGFDLEARAHTSSEMLTFLTVSQCCSRTQAAGENTSALLETESRLLGETVNWYARRAFVGVA